MRSGFIALLFMPLALAAQPVRVLFIGNSYTYVNDLPGLFDAFAASMGVDAETAMSAPGGYTFSLHAQNSATLQLLAQGGWDFVVLQEQSQLPSFPIGQVQAQCFPYAAQLAQLARAADPCTEVVYLMTWGRENGDNQNCGSWPPVCTYEGMQQLLRDRYVQMAVGNQGRCAPAGAVWRAHRMLFPATGLYTDGSHPNIIGSYIAASALACTLFRRSCEPASYLPAGMTAEQASAIRQLASAIVADSSSTWNIGATDPVAAAEWQAVGSQTVQFTAATSGAVAWQWQFGDGGSSTDAAPAHTYAGPGPHAASLIVFDGCGRSDTLGFSVDLGTGLDREPRIGPPGVRAQGAWLQVDGAGCTSMLSLFDAHGRLIGQWPIGPQGAHVAPPDAHGLLTWQLAPAAGNAVRGRIVLP